MERYVSMYDLDILCMILDINVMIIDINVYLDVNGYHCITLVINVRS